MSLNHHGRYPVLAFQGATDPAVASLSRPMAAFSVFSFSCERLAFSASCDLPGTKIYNPRQQRQDGRSDGRNLAPSAVLRATIVRAPQRSRHFCRAYSCPHVTESRGAILKANCGKSQKGYIDAWCVRRTRSRRIPSRARGPAITSRTVASATTTSNVSSDPFPPSGLTPNHRSIQSIRHLLVITACAGNTANGVTSQDNSSKM
jgi:hypothetical protein